MSRTEPRSRAAKAAARDYVSKVEGENSTAARILQAAEELLGEHGYDGVSMRDVAERAGITKALIFYHFRSKDDLFGTVLDRYYEAHAQSLVQATVVDGPPRDRIRRMLERYFEFISENRLYPKLVQQEIARGAGNLDKIRKNLQALYEAVAKSLEGVVPHGEGHIAARHFFLSFSAMVINYFTYASVMQSFWPEDPMSDAMRDERRKHLLWTVDAILEKLASGATPNGWPTTISAPAPASPALGMTAVSARDGDERR